MVLIIVFLMLGIHFYKKLNAIKNVSVMNEPVSSPFIRMDLTSSVSLTENILLALTGLKSNKMRAFLTMLGIIIGIASVIAIMTVGNSLNTSVASFMHEMGADNPTVGLKKKSNEGYLEINKLTLLAGRSLTERDQKERRKVAVVSDKLVDKLFGGGYGHRSISSLKGGKDESYRGPAV